MRKLLASFLNDFDFFFGQAVEFIDEVIDLVVGCIDLALQDGLVMTGFRDWQIINCPIIPKLREPQTIIIGERDWLGVNGFWGEGMGWRKGK